MYLVASLGLDLNYIKLLPALRVIWIERQVQSEIRSCLPVRSLTSCNPWYGESQVWGTIN
jgi:hypothetical protein